MFASPGLKNPLRIVALLLPLIIFHQENDKICQGSFVPGVEAMSLGY
jgi:hypothetical protein